MIWIYSPSIFLGVRGHKQKRPPVCVSRLPTPVQTTSPPKGRPSVAQQPHLPPPCAVVEVEGILQENYKSVSLRISSMLLWSKMQHNYRPETIEGVYSSYFIDHST